MLQTIFPGLTAYNSGKSPAEIELRRKSAFTMTYKHVAMIPFMIDASHLTPEEAAERAANPALWAARRYGMPEHIFQVAGKCLLRIWASRLTVHPSRTTWYAVDEARITNKACELQRSFHHILPRYTSSGFARSSANTTETTARCTGSAVRSITDGMYANNFGSVKCAQRSQPGYNLAI